MIPRQIRQLVERAAHRKPERRLVIAVDDLDKLNEPSAIRATLLETRSTLHLPCSFILTGHPLGILRNMYSSAGAVFDRSLVLKILGHEDLRTIMLKYLEAGRMSGTQYQEFHPFMEEAADKIISHSLGLPRLMNKISAHVLEQAQALRAPKVDLNTLDHCWRLAGENLRTTMRADTAQVIEVLMSHPDGLDPTSDDLPEGIYERLGIDSREALLSKLSVAVHADFAVNAEIDGQERILPHPIILPPSESSDE